MNNYYKGEVNGLRYRFVKTPGYYQKFAAMVCLFGSKDEVGLDYSFNRGIAHFIEHKLLVEADLTDGYKVLTDMGVYANAATTNNHTYFEISGTKIMEPLRYLIKSYFDPHFIDSDIEREKKVIIRELNMVNDRPGTKLFYRMQDAYFNHEPIANPIIGDEASINRISSKEMYECYNKFYSASNSVLILVGDLEEEDIINLLKEVTPKNRLEMPLKNDKYSLPKETFIEEEEDINLDKFFLDIRFQKESLSSYEKICLSGYLDQLFGEYSKPFKELFDKRLVNKSFYLSPYSGINYNGISIDSESKRPLESLEAITKLLRNKIQIDPEISEIFLKRYKASTLRISDSNTELFYKMIEFTANGLDLFEFIDDLLKVKEINFDLGYELLKNGIFIKAILKKSQK